MVQYQPIDSKKGIATVAMNIDMKVNFVPLWIMEMVCKKFCCDFLQEVVKVSGTFKGSKWDEKVQRHPDTFNFFRESMGSYFSQGIEK